MAATTSFAQSSIEIYGIIDQSYAVSTIKGSDNTGGFKYTLNNSGNQSGLATQRIGFRGTEDLGGGLKGRFQIESALSAGGAGDNGFGSRPTFVGLEGGFGTILLGRQDTPLLKAVVPQLAGGANNAVGQLMWSSFLGAGTALANTTLPSATVVADAGLGRMARETTIDRAINYITPTMSGFNAELQLGQSDAKVTGTGINTTVNAKTDDTGLNVKYANGPLTLNAATHEQKVTTNGATSRKNINNYAGATYDLGVANLSLQYAESKSESATAQFYKNKGTQIGAQVPVSATTALFASYGFGKRSFTSTDDYKQTFLQLGAAYSLSKRTKLYAVYGQQELKGDNAATTGEKWKETQYAFGVNHSF